MTPSAIKDDLGKRRAIVLGIGNTTRLDDGAGVVIVEALSESLSSRPNLQFEVMQTGGVDILSSISGFDYAVIVDAALMNEDPGEVKWLSIENQDKEVRLYSTTHSTGVLETLRMARFIPNLDLPDEIAVLGIQTKQTDGFGEKLTEPVAKGVEVAIRMILERFRDWGFLEKE